MTTYASYPVEIETVLEENCNDEHDTRSSNLSSCFTNDFSDIDVVIDMFANHIELNDG